MNFPFIVLISIFFFFWFCEKYISNKWYKVYYKFGIPIIYNKKYQKNLKSDNDFELHSINENLLFYRYGIFKQIGGPQFFDFSPFRGFIESQNDSKQVKLICFINWHIVFLIILLIYGIILADDLYAKLFIVGVLLFITYEVTNKLKGLKKIL